MDSKNSCHGIYSFIVFGRNLFNGIMNNFESTWFIAIVEEVYHYYKKKNNKKQYGFATALTAVDTVKQFYKIMWSENNFNIFYNTVTTAEECNIDLPELPHYLRLQIEYKSLPNVFTSANAYFPAILLKGCEIKIALMSTFPQSLQ